LHAPYRQSERSAIYREHIRYLVNSGHAYYAFDTPDELEAARTARQAAGHDQFQYNFKTRLKMKNSLSLDSSDVEARIGRGEPFVIRIRIPEHETVVFHDLIRGEVRVNTENLDDKVLFKSDGLPTYHLANVVDDYLMRITHVIRGEEWLPSAPMHLLLYRFFGWEAVMPQFAHLPLILKPDGNGKLSKRDGDRLGFPVFPLEWTDPVTGDIFKGYREEGYLPEAFINMLALLGWNPGTEQEIFTLQELISSFSIERVGKSGSKFDPEKAKWFNHQYLSHKSDEELAGYLSADLVKHGISPDPSFDMKVIGAIRERITLIPDLWSNAGFFYIRPGTYDDQVKNKVWQEGTGELIREFADAAELLQDFSKDSLHQLVQEFTTEKQVKTGLLMTPLRLLVVGSNQGPGMMDIAGILGKQEFLARIHAGLAKLS
jgi:glutamyl-tRNA synthetase